MEDRQNHEIEDDESLNDSGEEKQNSLNNYTEKDEEEEKIQVEIANNIHSGEIGIICGNEINNNENRTNDDSTNEEIATMIHPYNSKNSLEESETRRRYANMLKNINTIQTTMTVEDIERTLTQHTAYIMFLTYLLHSTFLRVIHTIT